ncbi:hypothetical protein C8E00_101633 [Chromohalobacter marismortui]|uniref:Uncharacterized protein n=1 Tax=Chromohalobacter marismortui TaxID=42055 RepID=A0A4R7NWR1_9GAMM|nr:MULTISPECIES: hypothetical protein [Chromohalobacter]MCI0511214.1 hypothetical protein [Chromohalobacter sp.]MCI0593930.1 hypothetical protein [Chromohalobacter sp.]TDU25239.1 hypothetical protein C8E00_101633 [Chromohalobacter marismortui]
MKLWGILLLVSGGLIDDSSSLPAEPPDTPGAITAQIARDHLEWASATDAEIYLAQANVRKLLKYPATAVFRDIRAVAPRVGGPANRVVCGQVNVRCERGDYTGYRLFVTRQDAQAAIMSSSLHRSGFDPHAVAAALIEWQQMA